jgi:hypothetical protein
MESKLIFASAAFYLLAGARSDIKGKAAEEEACRIS